MIQLSSFLLLPTLVFASLSGTLIDKQTQQPLAGAKISDANRSVYSDQNGSFAFDANTSVVHVKAYGYRPFRINTQAYDQNASHSFALEPIEVKALYLTFWAANTTSSRAKKLLKMIQKTQLNAVVVDVKNEYGSLSFMSSLKQADSYGAHDERTNRDIEGFMRLMKENNIYTIARIVTFKDELQASHNPEYAIRKKDGTIWRNHDNMAWVDPFDARAHHYAIDVAKEAAKVGFDEINFDYIRFPAREGLLYSQPNTQENRIKAIGDFLDLAQKELQQYGVFISVDTYGNICWTLDGDNNIGQTVASLARHADYLAPMLYPSGFASGSFGFKHPSEHPYAVIYRSLENMYRDIEPKRVRPWLQYFKDYAHQRRPYKKFEVHEQIRAAEDANTSGWMFWSPSSRYKMGHFFTQE